MANELHKAARNPEGYKKVKHLLSQVDINAAHTKHGTYAVDFAAQSGDVRTLQLLVRAGASLNASESDYNLFHWGLQNSPDIIEYITDRQVFEKFNDGTTDLHAAVVSGKLARVQEAMHQNPKGLRETNIRGEDALYWAGLAGYRSIVNFLISHPEFIQAKENDKFDTLNRGSGEYANQRGLWVSNEDVEVKIAFYQDALQCYEQIKLKNESDYISIANLTYKLGSLFAAIEKIPEACEFYQRCIDVYQYLPDSNKDKISKTTNADLALSSLKAKAALMTSVKSWGFKCINVEDDGDCFFYAVIYLLQKQFKKQPPESYSHFQAFTPAFLRKAISAHIRLNVAIYQDYMGEEVEKYLADIEEKSFWVDQLMIMAFARIYDLTVVIISLADSEPQIIKRADSKATLHLGYDGTHYQALLPIADYQSLGAIREAVTRAPLDDFQVGVKRKLDEITEAERAENNNQPIQKIYKESSPTLFSIKNLPSQPEEMDASALLALATSADERISSDERPSIEKGPQ